MEDFVLRMIDEQKALSEKIEKLKAFIDGSPIFNTLPCDEQIDRMIQLDAMSIYNVVLCRILERHGVKHGAET